MNLRWSYYSGLKSPSISGDEWCTHEDGILGRSEASIFNREIDQAIRTALRRVDIPRLDRDHIVPVNYFPFNN